MVQVVGILSDQFEGTWLFLSREHFRDHRSGEALWLSLTDEQFKQLRRLNGRLVVVEGRFKSTGLGHLVGDAPGLDKVVFVKDVERR